MISPDFAAKPMKDNSNDKSKPNQERIENFTSVLTFLEVVGEKSKSHPPPDLTEEFGLEISLTETHSTILILVFLLGIISNMVVLILFYRKPSLRTFSNRFVVNLSVIHLLQSILVTPYIIFSTFYRRWIFGSVWCQISGALSIALNMATVLSLLLIAVDRNCAVNSPLHYSMTITKRRTGCLIIGVWALALLSALPPLFGTARLDYRQDWNLCGIVWIHNDLCCIVYSTYLCLTGFVLPFLKMTYIYCSMFVAARTNSARARQHSVNSTTEPESSDVQERGGHGENGCAAKWKTYRRASSCGSQNFIFGQEGKAARTGIIILTSFFVCWFPYFAAVLTEPLIPPNQIPSYVPPVVVLLVVGSSVVDPYVYVFRTKAVRKHFSKILRCIRRHLCVCSSRDQPSKEGAKPVCRGQFSPRPTFGEFECNISRTHLWRTVLAQAELEHKLENQIIQSAPSDNVISPLNRDNISISPSASIIQGQPLQLSEQEILSLKSRDGFYVLKTRRVRCLSNESSDTGQTSPQSSFSAEEAPGSEDFEGPDSSSSSSQRKITYLRRGDSLVQYKEARDVPNVLSKFGVFRRRSYIVRRVDRSEDSSDTNMTSSTSTESQEPVCIPKRPRLVRQRSVTLSCCEESENGPC